MRNIAQVNVVRNGVQVELSLIQVGRGLELGIFVAGQPSRVCRFADERAARHRLAVEARRPR